MRNNRLNHWFSFLYRTRVKVCKDQTTTILNLSFLFAILAVSAAPWLCAIGLLIALALGYRFSIEKNAAQFSGDFSEVLHSAKQHVKNAMEAEDESFPTL